MKQKSKKMLLMLPVLVIPFLTMGFWALGGGKGQKEVSETKGLNLELPEANLKEDKGLDKLSFYNQAEKDSLLFQTGTKLKQRRHRAVVVPLLSLQCSAPVLMHPA